MGGGFQGAVSGSGSAVLFWVFKMYFLSSELREWA
jgi:hypothetical protein